MSSLPAPDADSPVLPHGESSVLAPSGSAAVMTVMTASLAGIPDADVGLYRQIPTLAVGVRVPPAVAGRRRGSGVPRLVCTTTRALR